MKVLIYVQHLLGIGHLARVSRIANALAETGSRVTLVSGGMPVTGFPGAGVSLVQLPPIRARDTQFSALVDAEDRVIDEVFEARRRDRLREAFDEARPDALLIEAFPFGRRQMRFELLPLLEHARSGARPPLIVSSVRDILQESRKAGRAEETVETIRDFFDLVLVHGDPAFVRLEDTFPLATRIADRILYTGLVAGPPQTSPDRFDVVVSAGGGIAGRKLIAAAAEAARQLAAELPRWCIITGPNLAEGVRAALDPPDGVRLETFRPDFPGLLANARISVSQAGYNTVCDLLRARCPAILIPFAEGGESEQSERAARLEKLGLASSLAETDLDGRSLAAAIRTAPAPSAHRIDLGGARKTATILKDRLRP